MLQNHNTVGHQLRLPSFSFRWFIDVLSFTYLIISISPQTVDSVSGIDLNINENDTKRNINNEYHHDAELSGVTITADYFLEKLFDKYGTNDTISVDGLQELISNIKLKGHSPPANQHVINVVRPVYGDDHNAVINGNASNRICGNESSGLQTCLNTKVC